MPIEFFSKSSTYRDFSNFSPHAIEIDGKRYLTVEHYYQSMKFTDREHVKKIRQAEKPQIAKQLGSDKTIPMRADWEAIKVDLMRAAVRQKFTTHPELTELLLGTGDEEIHENAPIDYFWGTGRDGSGQNWLGKILMELRTELRAQNQQTCPS